MRICHSLQHFSLAVWPNTRGLALVAKLPKLVLRLRRLPSKLAGALVGLEHLHCVLCSRRSLRRVQSQRRLMLALEDVCTARRNHSPLLLLDGHDARIVLSGRRAVCKRVVPRFRVRHAPRHSRSA